MAYHSIVLAKQVPDTTAVTAKAIRKDGTLNRSALSATFNHNDLNALEMALQFKERHGGTVTVITMGPPMASEILRESLYRGADKAILLTDKRFAAADTLATSYTLSVAIKKLRYFDLIFCGKEASDGNTAQVGPQVAEKLGLPQITYVEEIRRLEERLLEVRRLTDRGYEIVRSPLPLLLTVVPQANEPRPPAAKRLMHFKKAITPTEVASRLQGQTDLTNKLDAHLKQMKEKGLLITEWDADALSIDSDRCGRSGSPTWVKKIERVVLMGGEYKSFPPTDEGVSQLIRELIEDHTFG
ncbi:MAG: electron transfer flavoprotein subunit beta [Deltaproteobacteria bacterium DG_8]|nr:MAG: electron transfer flavoprotein subunit beta [Deltaproteobacteria bacterium DG_8]